MYQLLRPLSYLYGGLTDLYHYRYNSGQRRGVRFELPVINVGNLRVGGTGKTPMVEYLIRLLKAEYTLAVLSRGYKRRSQGFRLASEEDNSQTLGDEPYQYFFKYGEEVKVAVGEERILAIPEILTVHPDIEAILLDDAFQHRAIAPSMNILLSTYQKPFYEDLPFPAGRLRERRKGAERADMVVVSKCPDSLGQKEAETMRNKIRDYTKEETPIFFSTLRYHQPKDLFTHESVEIEQSVFAFAGIAQPQSFEHYGKEKFGLKGFRAFPDHHAFLEKELVELVESAKGAPLLCTEKDAMRLKDAQNKAILQSGTWAYVPIEVEFLFEQDDFDQRIRQHIQAFST